MGTSLNNNERFRRQKSATVSNNIEKVQQVVVDLIELRLEVAEIVGISKKSICYILTEKLYKTKLTARWVQRLLTFMKS